MAVETQAPATVLPMKGAEYLESIRDGREISGAKVVTTGSALTNYNFVAHYGAAPIKITRRFGISVLGSEQERTAWHFAGRPLRDPSELFVTDGEVPLVRGAIAHVGCSLHACHQAGDHTLYLGLVESLDSRPGEPVLFHRGVFGRVSPYEAELEQTWGW
jgi:hypothetical protein